MDTQLKIMTTSSLHLSVAKCSAVNQKLQQIPKPLPFLCLTIDGPIFMLFNFYLSLKVMVLQLLFTKMTILSLQFNRTSVHPADAATAATAAQGPNTDFMIKNANVRNPSTMPTCPHQPLTKASVPTPTFYLCPVSLQYCLIHTHDNTIVANQDLPTR